MDDDEPKLFMLALYAMKPDPDSVTITNHDDGSITWQIVSDYILKGFPSFMLHCMGVIAVSEDRARKVGMGKLMMDYAPPKEGWILHHIAINAISRFDVTEIAALATGDHETTDGALVM